MHVWIQKDEEELIQTLHDELHTKILGQEEALSKIAIAFK